MVSLKMLCKIRMFNKNKPLNHKYKYNSLRMKEFQTFHGRFENLPEFKFITVT